MAHLFPCGEELANLRCFRLHFFTNNSSQYIFQWLTLLLDMSLKRIVHERLIATAALHLITEPLHNFRIEPDRKRIVLNRKFKVAGSENIVGFLIASLLRTDVKDGRKAGRKKELDAINRILIGLGDS